MHEMETLEGRRLFAGLALGIGSTGLDFGTSTITDSSGNIYVTGTFQGKVDFKPGTGSVFLESNGAQGSSFIAKYTSAGKLSWAKRLGSVTVPAQPRPFGISGRIAVDPKGNVYTTGIFNGTTDFNPSDGVGGDIYLTKIDKNGKIIWLHGIGSNGLDAGLGIAVDPANSSVYVTGAFSGAVDFDPGNAVVPLNSQGEQDAFVAHFSTTGGLLWARGLGGSLPDSGIGVAVNSTGQAYVTGAVTSANLNYNDGTNIPSNVLLQTALSSAFVVKLSKAGGFLFAKSLGGGASTVTGGLAVAVDSGNDVFVGGSFKGTVDFDPSNVVTNLTPVGGTDAFLTKLSGGAGNFLITKRIGGSADDAITDVKTTADGFVYVSGFYHGNAVTVSGSGAAKLASKGGADQFIARFRVSGKYLGARSFGAKNDDWAIGLAIDAPHGFAFTTGFIDGTAAASEFFDLISLTSGGNISVYRTNLTLTPA